MMPQTKVPAFLFFIMEVQMQQVSMCTLCCRHQEDLDRRRAYNAERQREYSRQARTRMANVIAENCSLTAQNAQVDVQHGAVFVDREVLRMAVKEAEQRREQLYAQAQARATNKFNPKCIAQGCKNPCIRLCNCPDCPYCNK